MTKSLTLGVDIGTGGCKATVIDMEGHVVATAYEEMKSDHSHRGWSEQDPSDWISAFTNTVKECLRSPGLDAKNIAGIGFSASTHNAVLLGEKGEVLRPCIMWNDQRAAPQASRLAERYGKRIFEIAMQMPSAGWAMPQLLWVKENDPDNFGKIRRLLSTKDYVRGHVTGDYVTDLVDAQGTLLFDARKREWSAELCGMIGLNPAFLPPVLPTLDIAGKVRKEVAEETGLIAGTPVIYGCSDTASEDYGAGGVEAGQLLIKVATAGNVTLILNEPQPHPKGFTYPHAVRGMWYLTSGTNACALSLRWLRDTMYALEKAQCEKDGTEVYEYMEAEAAQAPVGARGMIYHPYLLGERCPYYNAEARGDFFGIGMVHDRRHFARAVMEGVAFSLRDCFQVAQEVGGNANSIRLIGGGGKNKLWSQIICDVFGLAIARPEKDDSSFGNAMLAAVGVGLFENEVTAINQCNRVKMTFQPNMENHEKYCRLFEIYREITKVSIPIWSKLNKAVGE
ncbi:MAG: xylulokinase [Planctomycetaceae bacterium]|nr:xylulokinase [Planctomycetaceae bacterium]